MTRVTPAFTIKSIVMTVGHRLAVPANRIVVVGVVIVIGITAVAIFIVAIFVLI